MYKYYIVVLKFKFFLFNLEGQVVVEVNLMFSVITLKTLKKICMKFIFIIFHTQQWLNFL